MSSLPARIVRCLTIAAIPLVLAGCGGAPALVPDTGAGAAPAAAASPIAVTSVTTTGERAAAIAADQVGVPYRYGGRSTDGFDCSGLVSYAWARAGNTLPRTTAGLWRHLRPVDAGELRPGDVLFFDIEGKPSHVGLYLGRGRFVHAPSTGRAVGIEELDSPYYSRAFIRGGRPL